MRQVDLQKLLYATKNMINIIIIEVILLFLIINYCIKSIFMIDFA